MTLQTRPPVGRGVAEMIAEHATDEVLFEEEQSFRQPWLWGLLLGSFLVAAACLGWGFLSRPGTAGSAVVPAVLFVLLWGGLCLFLYSLRLTVRVDHRHLQVRFFPLM